MPERRLFTRMDRAMEPPEKPADSPYLHPNDPARVPDGDPWWERQTGERDRG